MDQNAANQNMEDWEMGEDYSIERGSHGHPHDMDEGCGDGKTASGVSTGVDRLVRKNLKEIQKNQIRNWVKK